VIKLWSPLKRLPGTTLEQFAAHWRTIHREHALKLVPPGYMQGYVQNHRVPEAVPGLEAPGDGCPEVWVGTVENVIGLGNSREYREGALQDEPRFMIVPAVPTLTRTVIARGPAREPLNAGVRALFFLPPSARTTRSVVEWIDPRPWLMPGATPVRFERDRSLTAAEAQGIESQFGGIESSWWPDTAAFQAAWRAHAAPAAAQAGVAAMLVKELIVVTPQSWG
jgi:hypothetical protein